MKKILFYTDTPLFGGAEKQLILLAKFLPKSEFEMMLVCGKSPALKPLIQAFQELGLKVYRSEAKHKHSPSNYFELLKILEIEKPALLHIQIWNPMAGKYAFMAASKLKIPVVATEHDPFELKGAKRLIKKHLLQKTTAIITVSKANEDLMKALYHEIQNIRTIHNGLDFENFEKPILQFPLQEQHRLKREILESDDLNTQIILSVGTLHERKGYKYLLEAFTKVKKEVPNCKLVLVGEGPERTNLEDFRKNLDFVHDMKILSWRDDIAKIMTISDLFVLPSLKEAFGLVILEAMAMKLPVVASNVGGIPEILQPETQDFNSLNAKYGMLTEPGNSLNIAESMLKFLNKDGLREKTIFLAHARCKEFSAEKMARKTAELYSEMV